MNKNYTKTLLVLGLDILMLTLIGNWEHSIGKNVLLFETVKYGFLFVIFALPFIIEIVQNIRNEKELDKQKKVYMKPHEALEEAFENKVEVVREEYRHQIRYGRSSGNVATMICSVIFMLISVVGLVNCICDFAGGTEQIHLKDAKCINYNEVTKEVEEFYTLTGINKDENNYEFRIKDVDPAVCGVINLEDSDVLLNLYPHIGKLTKFEVYTDDTVYVIPEGENPTYDSRSDVHKLYNINNNLDESVETEQESNQDFALEIKEGIQSGEYAAYEMITVDGLDLPEYENGEVAVMFVAYLDAEYDFTFVTMYGENYSEYETYIKDLVTIYGIDDESKCYFCFKDDNVVIVAMDELHKIKEVHAVKIIEE